MQRLFFLFSLIWALNGCLNPSEPSWFTEQNVKGYDNNRYIVGFASGPYFKGNGVKHVEKKAKGQIARQLQSHIKSRLDFMQYSRTHNGKEKFGDSIFNLVKEESSIVISNVLKLKKELDNEQKMYYSALAIDRQELANNYRNEIIGRINMMNEYNEAKTINEVFFNYRMKEALKIKIEVAKMNGKLFGSEYFKPLVKPTPSNPLQEYKLTFGDGTEKKYQENLKAMLIKNLAQFGISFNNEAERILLCNLSLKKVTNRTQPTMSAHLTLYEVADGKSNLAYKGVYTESHPSSYDQLEGLMIRTWLAVAMRNKLKMEVDPRVNKIIDARRK